MSEISHNHGEVFLDSWQLAPEILIPALAAAALYWWRSEALTLGEKIAFYLGLTTIFAVVQTPVGVLATTYFWCHMIQHMVLMMLSGPLLVMGTVRIFRPHGWIWRTITDPWISWFLYAGLIIGVHFTALHSIIMDAPWIHNFIEVPAYIFVAYAFYYNILDRDNARRRISPAIAVMMLFFMMVPETLTGFFIYAAPTSLYGEMFTIDDQRLGGALMWSGSMILDAIWLVIAVSDWLKSETEKSKLIDAEIAREQRG